jgi:hypothetical protein
VFIIFAVNSLKIECVKDGKDNYRFHVVAKSGL